MNGLSDLDAVRPVRARPKGGKGKSRPKVRSAFALARRLRSRATLVIASAGFSAIMVGILCNALLLQKGHHPSPLFASPAAPASPRPSVEAPASAPVPAPAPIEAAPRAPAPDPAPPAPVAPLVRHVAAPHAPHSAARATKGRDDIARLLGSPPNAAEPPARLPVRASLPSSSAPLQLHKVRPGHLAAKGTAPVARASAIAD